MYCGCLTSVSSWVATFFKEGGSQGWFAVLGLFSTWMAWIGLVKGMAVMLPTLQEQFETSTWLIGWMVAIIDASVEFSAIFASPLREKLGVRVVVTGSGVIVGASLIASAFASSLFQIAILLTLFAAPAIGLSNIVTREVIGRSFKESFPTAISLGGLGSSLAFVTCVPLTQFFLDVYGWRGTMLLLGGILSHLAVCGAVLKQPKSSDGYQTVAAHEELKVTGAGETASNSRCCSWRNSSFISRTFELGLLTSVPFWLIIFMTNIWVMMYSAWLIYFVPYTTVSKGFSLTDASDFVVSYGIGRILGSLTIGPLVKNVFSNSAWLGSGLLISSIYYFIFPWLASYWPMFVSSFIFAYFDTIPLIIFDIIIVDIYGANQLGLVLGWNGLVAGVTRVISLYFPGLMYDVLGSYTLAFLLIGGIHSLTLVAVLALAWLQRRRSRRL